MTARTLTQYLLDAGRSGEQRGEFAHILSAVAVMVKQTAAMLSRGPLILDQVSRPTPRAAKEVNRAVRRLATKALFAHTVGLLVLSHTGRIRMFRQASQDLFNTYLAQLIERAETAPRK